MTMSTKCKRQQQQRKQPTKIIRKTQRIITLTNIALRIITP